MASEDWTESQYKMVEFHEVVGLSQHRNEVLVTQLCPALRPHQGNPSQHRVSNIMDEDFPEEKEDKTTAFYLH